VFSAGRKPDRLFLRFDKLTKTALGETFAKGQLTLVNVADLGAGPRATAKVLGVSEQSVARDLGKSRGNAPKGANGETDSAKNSGSNDADAPKGAPWFQSDARAI
jgi:hypothetical protein